MSSVSSSNGSALTRSGLRWVPELLLGNTVHGWALDPASPGQEQFEAVCGPQRWPLVVRRTLRHDVAAALGLDNALVGVELDLPTAWLNDPQRDAQACVLLINGQHPAQQGDLRTLLARRHQHLQSGEPRWAVEGLIGLHLRGWLADPSDLPVRLGLLCNGQPLDCLIARTERADVESEIGQGFAAPGFVIELPGQLWRRLAPDESARLQILADGRPLGPELGLSRSDLLDRLEDPRVTGSPRELRLHRLLVLEHLVVSGAWAGLPAGLRCDLAKLGESVGLGDLDRLLNGPPHEPPLPPPDHDPHPIRSWLLRRRTVARMVLALLSWARQRPQWAERGREWEITLTQASGLLHRDTYNLQAPPQARGGLGMARHYVTEGDARSLVPNPFLSPRGYVGQLPGRRHPGVNRLLHYTLAGRFQKLSPSPWFDTRFYLETYGDVALSGMDPLLHFLRYGWREGRKPLPEFDLANEARQGLPQRLARLASASASDPVLGYLLRGLPPGAPLPVGTRLPWMPSLSLEGRDFLDPALWRHFQPRTEPAQVDVLIPVYAGIQETLACIWTVLSAPCRTPFELVVVDDRSPDPALSAMLATLADRGLLTLRINLQNLGFVRTVNRGLALHGERDVVILNADTLVFNDWLDRLLAHFDRVPDAATVTPLSNNATICSYPRTLADNGPLSFDAAAALDRLTAQVNAGQGVEVPTGVGFCMAMRRRCLNQIGPLDAEAFGRGYGEENDWCQRAAQAGWRNLLVSDIFVPHQGSVSFAAETDERIAAAMQILAQRYPGYAQHIASYIKADPLLPSRVRLDVQRLRQAAQQRPFALQISHARGGGTARHEEEQAALFRARGMAVVRLRPSTVRDAVTLISPDVDDLPNLENLPLATDGLLLEVLQQLDVRAVQLHHLVDLPMALRQMLPSLCQALHLTPQIIVHDYHLICPRINLAQDDGRYCGEPDDARCDRCLASDGLLADTGPIARWRADSVRLLNCAHEVLVPDEDVRDRLHRYAPALAIKVVPHESTLLVPTPNPVHRQIRQVMVVGAINRVKGFDVLCALARSARARELGLEFTLLGYSMDDLALRDAGVKVLGRYDDSTLVPRLRELNPDLVLIPSLWPETYCYVVSSVLLAGCTPAVFDIGAQARRIREAAVPAVILPLALAGDADALAEVLVAGPNIAV